MTPRNLTILLLLLAAALTAGCGADNETKPSIPATTAQSLDARLAEVQRRFDVGGGACDDITNDSQPAVESILASLPSSVDSDVRSALTDSFDRLFELTAEQCDNKQDQATTTETQTQTQTETTDTTETQTTDTTPTDTTNTETTPTTETNPAPPTDDGNGGTDGGGAGPGL